MKLKQTIVISMIAIAGFTSCEKNLYDPNQAEKENLRITDLKIPADFDWKMIENGTCTISSAQAVKVGLYADESFNDASLLATTVVKSGGNVTLPIALVRGAQNIYVQYEYASGEKREKAVAINSKGEISMEIPASSTTRGLTDDDFIKEGSSTLYYPNKDFGTIMFEDNYPALGDYDFNDFVADYQIQLKTSPSNANQITSMTLIMEVKAIGANQKTHHYIPHLSMPIPTECIDGIEAITRQPFTSAEDEVKVENVTAKSNKNGYVVLAFNRAELNSKKNPGSEFLNTEKGFITATKTVIVDITFKKVNDNTYADLEYIKFDGFDFFLATSDQSKEIHMRDYIPVFNLSEKPDGYKNENNYVWGINIPKSTVHTYEKANFLSAYPDFKTWLANPSYKWYVNGNKDYLFGE